VESNHSYFRNSNFLNDYEVTIRGFGDVKLFSLDEEAKTNGLNTDLAINVDIQGKIEEHFRYGIQLTERLNNNFKKNRSFFGYVDNIFGKFEFGNTLSATEISRVGGDSLGIGNGGIFGEFSRIIVNSLSEGQYFILREGTLSSQMFGYYNSKMDMDYFDHFNYIGKINYYSPDFFGLRVLASFAPNVKLEREMFERGGVNDVINLGDVASVGINYINTFDSLGLALSLARESNTNVVSDRNAQGKKIERGIDISSTVAGANVNFFGFTFSGSYGILERKNVKNSPIISDDRASYMDYGVGYEAGNVLFGYNFFKSEMEKKNNDKYADQNAYTGNSFSLELKTDKNFSVYVELIKFTIEDLEKKEKKDGKMAMLGALINFY
jgi:hypothetical protein